MRTTVRLRDELLLMSSSRSAEQRLQVAVHQSIALVLLLILSPVMLVVSLLVWRQDGAPLLFGHYRVGKDGTLFRCLKFRSMRLDAELVLSELLANDEQASAEWSRDHKLADDPRITTIGSFLRRTSLDELPQLLNVVRGEMLLVGPRPITFKELARYGSSRWHYLSVMPGITGLWQVSGRNDLTYDERVALDRKYVDSRSFLLDLKILLRTVKVVIFRDGAR